MSFLLHLQVHIYLRTSVSSWKACMVLPDFPLRSLTQISGFKYHNDFCKYMVSGIMRENSKIQPPEKFVRMFIHAR